MPRFDPETNQWHCKIVLFGPTTEAAIALARTFVEALPAKERTLSWDPPVKEVHQVCEYKPKTHSLGDIVPVYVIHALRKADSTAVDRQHVLHTADGVVLLIDTADVEASRFAVRELERFLGMFGKMIATMPVLAVATAALDDAQRTQLQFEKPIYVGPKKTSEALTALTKELEQESGLTSVFASADDDDDDDDDASDSDDWDDIEFDDLHAYDDDE